MPYKLVIAANKLKIIIFCDKKSDQKHFKKSERFIKIMLNELRLI
jgi:hypothetical protein